MVDTILELPREASDAQHRIDEHRLRAKLAEITSRRPAVGLAVGVVGNGGLDWFYGHGVADIASGERITQDTVFQIASITKTFTAVAVMQLYERGLVDLDAPINDYLRAYKLIAAEPNHRRATVRDVLTHTAGIPESAHPFGAVQPDFGESVRTDEPMPTLTEFYGGSLRMVAEPGTRFRYGNHGFATLGQLVEDVSSKPLAQYLREHIFEPLGMSDTGLGRSGIATSRLATGYTLRANGARAVPDREMVTAGAASIYSTPVDMSRYVAALLTGGTNNHGSVLKPATIALMFAAQYQPDPRLPGMGLAFFRADVGGHRCVEHQGIRPGFDSHLVAAPDEGIGLIAFTNGARQAALWLPDEMSGLLQDLVGVSRDVGRPDVAQRPDRWGDFCGWYRLDGPLSDVRIRGALGAGVEVFVRGGKLMIRALSPVPPLYRGLPLLPDDPTDPEVFRIDLSKFELGSLRVVFSRKPDTGTRWFHMDMMPLSLEKQPAATNPRRWARRGLTAAAVATVALRRTRG